MPDHLPNRAPLDFPMLDTPEERLRTAEAALRAAMALGSLGSILAFAVGLLIGWMV